MFQRLLTLFILLLSLSVSAQIDSIPYPNGYTQSQLQLKNVLRVSPDDHIWVGFGFGAGEYDGANWKIYNNTNGLPNNFVSAFAFDGPIKWIGTHNGLVKTDGVNLVSFNTLNSPLPSNKINDLYFSDSTLWIATDSGAVSLHNSNWQIYNTSNSPIHSDKILCISKNNFGVYVSDQLAVSVLTNNGWQTTSPNISPVYRFTSDQHGNLYNYNYQIHDTVFKMITIPTDPCFLNSIQLQPVFILGEVNNSLISMTNQFPKLGLMEIDSNFNIQNYYLTDQTLFSSLIYLITQAEDTFKLYDFNSSGKLISTTIDSKIFVTGLNGLTPITRPDTCPYLDINQVRARIWNNGSNFWDLDGNTLYETPKGSGKSPIFSEGIWIGGKDPQGKLHLAAQTYRQSGNDFWPGPLDTVNAMLDPATYAQFDKLWKIDRYTVNDFIQNFQNGSVANGSYVIPDIIKNWPAHASGNFSRSLAPFIDVDHDGIYDPMHGDYPNMKGDQMIWWVFNDNVSVHGETGCQYNLGVEVHASAYAYSCPSLSGNDSVLNYTTFYHYDFINRSDTSYHDVYIGVYDDVDLGNFLDDYVGCDTSLDIAFVYNGDDDDENGNSRLYHTGYGLHPPVFDLAILKGPDPIPNDNIDNNHNGIVDEPGEHCMMNYFVYSNNDNTVIGNPFSPNDHYNRLQGIWKDGVPQTYFGNGYDTSSTAFTHYAYSGPPFDSIGWSENHPCPGCQPNPPSDRRFTTSAGPFDLPLHETRSIDYAYIFTRDPDHPNGKNTSMAVNHDQVLRIKHFFETDSFPCSHLIGINEINNDGPQIFLYPVPAHSELNVSLMKADQENKSYCITDVLGKIISGQVKINSSSFQIDLSGYSAGIYFLHVRTKDGVVVRKFIVE